MFAGTTLAFLVVYTPVTNGTFSTEESFAYT